MSKTRVNLFMQNNLHQELQVIADRDDRSVSDLIREACREFIYRDKRKGVSKYFEETIKDEGEIDERCND